MTSLSGLYISRSLHGKEITSRASHTVVGSQGPSSHWMWSLCFRFPVRTQPREQVLLVMATPVNQSGFDRSLEVKVGIAMADEIPIRTNRLDEVSSEIIGVSNCEGRDAVWCHYYNYDVKQKHLNQAENDLHCFIIILTLAVMKIRCRLIVKYFSGERC